MKYKGTGTFKKTITTILLCLAAITVLANNGETHEPSMTHRMMILAFQLGSILLAGKLVSIIFEKIKIPGVIGEIAAGILIGPYVMGCLPLPGLPEGLFPLNGSFPVSPELYGFCSIAAIVLLFTVGLETDIKLFMRYSLAGSLVGIGGALVSFVIGDLSAVLFSSMLFQHPVGFLSAPALFLGTISTATSVGISARILSEKHKLDSPEGITILAGAVIDDVIGIIILAVSLGIIAASSSGLIDWGHIGLISAKAIGIWLIATIIGIMAAQKIGLLLKLFRDRSTIAVMALALSLILAGLFEEAGLAMIVGAYIMGLSLSRTDINHVIREKLQPVASFLVPIFFVVMGMLVDVRMLASRNVIMFGTIYTAGAIIAKIIGCGLPMLFCNFNTRGALRIGVGMLPRGEVALIIAGIGLAAGILTKEIFGVSIMMTLLTTLAAPPLLVAMFKSSKSGLRHRVKNANTELRFSFPSEEVTVLLVNKLLESFQSEDFFTHVLSRTDHIYQLRKDSTIINFRRTDNDIIFQCDESHVTFVNTAMYEIIAELEIALEELKKPIDSSAIALKLQKNTITAKARKSLARLISIKNLTPYLKGNNKKEIIEELLSILDKAKMVKDVKSASKAVWLRENTMSTGMQYGIALPHAKTDAVTSLVCAIGLKKEGVDFNSMDGLPSSIFVLILSPKTTSGPHVEFLSTISQILDEEGRESLLTCTTAVEMYSVLTGRQGSRH